MISKSELFYNKRKKNQRDSVEIPGMSLFIINALVLEIVLRNIL